MKRTESGKDHFGYSAMLQGAARSVLRTALRKAIELGALPADHHFYITFRTRTPGVQMSDSLKDRYPDEMTIVIQHQYWDLSVTRDAFSIMLKFSGNPETLVVPFAAVTRFVDPSVGFILNFDANVDPQQLMEYMSGDEEDESGPEPSREATVVSLDAFRRK